MDSAARDTRPTAEQAQRKLDEDLLGLSSDAPAGEVPELFTGVLARSGTPPVVDPSANAGRDAAVATAEAPTVEAVPRRARRSRPRAARTGRVGILFVHGVGSQEQGDTLKEFGTPLVDWLEEWHRSRGLEEKFRVTWSDLSPTSATQPAAAIVTIPAWQDPGGKRHALQSWILAEAWWASRLEDPPYATMLNWAGRRSSSLIDGLRSGAIAAARRALRARKRSSVVVLWLHFVNAIVFSLIYSLFQALGTIALAILALIAKLPIPALNDLILARLVRPVLVNNVGDFYVCLYDRIQAVNIRLGIFRAINWLVEVGKCERILVAAHSGGTVVILDALGTSDLTAPGERAGLREKLKRIKTVMTFGAALNNAWDEADRDDEFKQAREIPDRLQTSAKWIDLWADFDWATTGRPLQRGSAREGRRGSVHVTNGLSPVTDHGGYLSNYEEFYGRIAQEADRPGHRGRSRFWPGTAGQVERLRRRRDRVTMLVFWRFLSIVFVLAAAAGRTALGTGPVTDGAALWSLSARIPALGGALDGLNTLGLPLVTSASIAGSGLGAMRDVLLVGLYLVPLAVIVIVAYELWVAAFYSTWSERMSRASARTDDKLPKARGEIALRSLGFAGMLVIVLVALWAMPAYRSLVDLLPKA